MCVFSLLHCLAVVYKGVDFQAASECSEEVKYRDVPAYLPVIPSDDTLLNHIYRSLRSDSGKN